MRWFSWLLVMAVMVGSTTLWAAGGVLPGGGTEGDPYLVEDLADFDRFAGDPNYWDGGVYTTLACDPNLADRPYTTAVIAPDTPDTSDGFDGTPFEGIFDGDDHVISNLTIDTVGADNDYLGLFGDISGSSAEVKNLGMENVNITGGDYSHMLGGLCGTNWEGTITNCYSEGSVTGGFYVGGLCGTNTDGTITNCYSGGSVTSDEWHLGGLCGGNNGEITNCYSEGSVTGGDYVGGLCGWNRSRGTITNCYSGGSVTGDVWLPSGLCDMNDNIITNCFWDIETSGTTWSDGGTGLPTAQMQTLSTFVDAEWDFINVWNIGEHQTYPYIRSYSAADINKDRITNFGDLCIVAGEWMNEN